jgi:threonine-phosphate decarboxylase
VNVQKADLDTDNFVDSGENEPRAPRTHGGNIYEAARRYDIAEKRILDFSSNANPLGPSSAATRAAKRALALMGRYPDPETAGLRKAVARYFGLKSDHAVCGAGASGLLHLIPRVFRPKKVLIPVPTFTEYAASVRDAGGEAVPLLLKEHNGFRVDPIEMSFALKGMDMAILCNPNNPTGMLIPKAEMLEIARYALDQGVRLIVDESFMDYAESESIVKDAVQTPHIICVRSFDAFFGLPGIRAGYAVANEATAAVIREGQEPWTLNIPAEQAAIAALNDWGYIKRTRRLVQGERDRLLSALRILPGVETFPCSANFILFKLTSFDGFTLIQKLGERGMFVRECSSFPGLDSRYIRIAVRTRRENIRLIKALRELLIS